MKKTQKELEQFIYARMKISFPSVDPLSDNEFLSLLPDNQYTIIFVLRNMIVNKKQDYWYRYAAARYMIECFADTYQIKDFLNRMLKTLVLCKSRRAKSFDTRMIKAVKQEGLRFERDKRSTREILLEEIARLQSYNPDCIKKWSWKIEGEKLTCSIGKKKLF